MFGCPDWITWTIVLLAVGALASILSGSIPESTELPRRQRSAQRRRERDAQARLTAMMTQHNKKES